MQKIAHSERDKFWEWFLMNEDRLFYFELYEAELLPETLKQIQKIHPDLVFEISPEIDGKRDFIVSANGLKEAFPTVIELVRSAPQLDAWNIIPFRQRKQDLDIEIEIDDVVLAPADILFDYDYNNLKVDLDIYVADIDADDERIYHIIFILLDTIIGEYDVEMKIGRIDIHNLEKHKNINALRCITEVPRIVDNLGKKIVN